MITDGGGSVHLAAVRRSKRVEGWAKNRPSG